jgi:hypothetical protein
MEFLFDSNGRHIANLVGEQLHAPNGPNIGHWRPDVRIFIDMQGRYFGEILDADRLMYNVGSPYRGINYGNFGNYGNAGNYGNPGNPGRIGSRAGFTDVDATWL